MELSLLMKLRIAAAACVGVVLVGIVAWPRDNPPDPYGSVLALSVGTSGTVTLMFMAFLAGLIVYFIAWPYGREIGILAVPFGLTIWAVRAGNTGSLMQLYPTIEQRHHLLSTFQWEPLFWLAVIVAGLAGVALGQTIRPTRKQQYADEKGNPKSGKYLNPVIGLLVSFVIVQLCIKILAKDVILSDKSAGFVVSQPAIGQIIFAVLVSFGLAAFVVHKLFNVNYYWPIAVSFLVTAYSVSTYAKGQMLSHIAEVWPGPFFTDVIISVLPIQMVVFGTLGSIAGYWIGVRHQYYHHKAGGK